MSYAQDFTEGEHGTEGEPGKPGIGGGGEGGKGGKGGKGGRGAILVIKHSRLQDTSDVILTIFGIAFIIAIAFVILQNRNTAKDLENHQTIQAQAAVESCFQRNAEAVILRRFLQTLKVHTAKEPRVRESIETYLANLDDTTPSLLECRQLAIGLEVSG